ncbi:MAG TPA: hypothetical protein VIG79_09710 [Lapillicoccus sp.]|uniref:hypothetical protein n=1 Tax=Lapillicoccus sp. TaxID=1909287 RepID=UPI002F92794D
MSLGPPGAAPATEIREPGIRRTVWRRWQRRTENPADLRTVHAAYARLDLALAS